MIVTISCSVAWSESDGGNLFLVDDLTMESSEGDVPARPAGAMANDLVEGMVARATAERATAERLLTVKRLARAEEENNEQEG